MLQMLGGGLLLLVAGSVSAVDLTVNITGKIVIPPCTVNNGQSIEVDFGDVPVTDVTNSKFRQKKDIAVTCTYYQGTPYIKMTGTQLTGAGTNVLKTNISNFGIALYQGDGVGTPLVLGNGTSNGSEYIGYRVTSGLSGTGTSSGIFTFTAAPSKTGSAELSAGAFNATASMSITYM
ncbi:fimbrial protein [Salmonella enterica]|nr:fimbrial protein [Salmonella enterica subsp. enterica serovar Oslo]EHW8352255.1 fimbrial protein [Salmonella enterica]EHW8353111.1 fimbrial protein [Salmonella enterica]